METGSIILMDIAIISLVIGLLFASMFLIPLLFSSGKAKSEQSSVNVNASSKGPKSYTKSEVSLHNKRTDCWIIINDKVYDVTPYVEEHPGGDAILVHAGDDSTEGFFGPQHGTRVFDMIEDFCVGKLEK